MDEQEGPQLRRTSRKHQRVGLIIAAMMVAFAVPAQGYAGEADEVLINQKMDVSFTVPTLSVILSDLDEGGTTCQYDLNGTGRVSRPSGSGFVTERGSVVGSTGCSKNVTTTLTITDSSLVAAEHYESCQDTRFKSSGCSTSQTVGYFAASGILSRSTSTIIFRYRLLTGNKERVCFEYKVTLVGGTAAVQGAGPCDDSAV